MSEPDRPASTGYLVVANSRAGSAERAALERAREVLATSGPVEMAHTGTPEDLDRVLARRDGRTLVVAGGDGSLHAVLDRLLPRTGEAVAARSAGSEPGPHGDEPPTLGLLPLGTGNDLARGLDLPLDPAGAAERIVAGRARAMPILRLSTGEVAMNNAHVGLGAAAAQRGADLKGRLGRWAYPVGAALAGLTHRAEPVTVRVDGEVVHDGPATACVLALGPSAGGGNRVVDDGDVTEPVLHAVVVGSTGVRDRLRLVRDVLRHGLDEGDGVVAARGREATLSLAAATRVVVDGEFRRWSGDVTAVVDAAAWTVLA